jgi:sporadic carbohydrate cluster 2OG-Fe(II) oxygenase
MQNEWVEDGYFIHQFTHLNALQKIKKLCDVACLSEFNSSFSELENYHKINVTPEQHDGFQFNLFSSVNKSKLHHQFVMDNIDFFTALFGPDLDVQTQAYLRISRPNQKQDNIGLHRDTDYGNSAYEVSFSLPLIDQAEGSGLNIIPGSHKYKEHVVEQVERQDVVKGTPKHEMGFLYAPKIPVKIDHRNLKCVSLPFGSGLGFTLGLIHGQIMNTSKMTRWSIDFRVKNSFHPVTKNLKDDYYSSFRTGLISDIAQKYYNNNPKEKSTLISASNRVKQC